MNPALPLIFSAAFVGFVHSLSPGHWLPVVLLVKARKWDLAEAALGALVAASGHIFVSAGLGLVGLFVGKQFFGGNLHELEEHAGLILIVFGLIYRWKVRHIKKEERVGVIAGIALDEGGERRLPARHQFIQREIVAALEPAHALHVVRR